MCRYTNNPIGSKNAAPWGMQHVYHGLLAQQSAGYYFTSRTGGKGAVAM
jgi:hypothetical protein